MASTSHHGTDERVVTCLTDVRGTVYRIFGVYGFISVKDPVNASVYFDVKVFEDAQHSSLRSAGLQVGDAVILDAKLGPKHCDARFRAIRVTRAPVTMSSSSPSPSPHSDNGAGRASTVTSVVNQYGVIETVKPNYGFIKFGPNQSERAFFHADTVDKSLEASFKTLPDVVAVGDKVRLNAERVDKPSGKVNWKATAVSPCRSDDSNDASDSEGQQSSNEVFMSDEEFEIEDLLQAKLNEYDSHEAESPAGYADWDADCSEKGNKGATYTSGWERRRKLAGERGFFHPVTESSGTVKFGPGSGLAASAAVEVTYREEELIDNLLREVADGQEVLFDAVQAEDNSWIATLVWIGNRPAKPRVGDSEDIFNGIINKTLEAEKPFPNTEPGPSGDVGGEKTRSSVGPGYPPIQPCISIYKDAKAIIVETGVRTGTCIVQELAVSRKIKFTSECFYKDGTVFTGDLREVLRAGDTVLLDFMVALDGTKEQTRCDLVWQGKRPTGVQQTTPEEFRQQLKIDTQDAENSPCFEDPETEIERADEVPRDPSRQFFDNGLPEDTVSTSGCEGSSTVSVAGLLDALPTATSTPAWMRSPRADI